MRKGIVILICLSIIVFMTSCSGSSSSGGGGPNNTSPVAQITTPSEGGTYIVGDVIQFSGSAADTEDGAISGSSLVWTSDVDGQIGTDETFTSSTLSAGAHQITFTATDSAGAVGMDTMAMTVNAGPATGILPDTGQTASYTDAFGEDSDYTLNPPHYTKLDAAGNDLDNSAASWTMVRDDVTGLIWEVKTDDSGIHDKDKVYTWQNAQDVFIVQLNSDNFGGHADWRLPTVKELSALFRADAYLPVINTAYFPHTVSSKYWSSTIYAFNTQLVWIVGFNYGYTNVGDKSSSYHENYVRAVRGGQSSTDLVNNGDGTVTDRSTGLMWQQAEGGFMTWEAALAYCENLDLAGHDDWRLPNLNELHSIVDYEEYDPAIDTTFFSGTLLGGYWSSTTFTGDTGDAWSVGFKYGYVGECIKLHNYYGRYVRAVRGGQ